MLYLSMLYLEVFARCYGAQGALPNASAQAQNAMPLRFQKQQ